MGYGVIINTDDIVGIYEIAEYAGVRTTAVINWKNRYSDFPKPVWSTKGNSNIQYEGGKVVVGEACRRTE